MNSTFADLFAYLQDLMTSHGDFFVSTGLNMFRGFAVILIVWFGVKTALAASGGHGGFRLDHFAQLLLTIAFGLTMIKFYATPIPGFGRSFSHLITDEGIHLANRLDSGLVQDVFDHLNQLYLGLESPGLSIAINVLEGVRWAITILAICAAQVALFVVISFGYVASAVAVLVGPIFIPFFIVPKMEWLFWGWLRCFVQYAFYPVIAYAYLYVFGQLLIHFCDVHKPPYDGATAALLFMPLLFLLVAFTYGIIRVPSLVNSLFTGRAGDSALPKI
jgi:hypothetical protein